MNKLNLSSFFKWFSIGLIGFWLTFFILIPSSMIVIASFLTRGDQEFIVFIPTLDNYRRLFDTLYLTVFWYSLCFAALTTIICLILGYPFAYLLAKTQHRYKNLLLLLVIIPFWTSSLVRTYALITLLKTKGLINDMLLWLGLIHTPLELLYTDSAVLVGLVYSLLPFMILPLYVSLEKLDIRLIEVAQDLGARPIQIFRDIIIPLTLPGITAGSMLVFLPTLGIFYIPDLLGGAKTLLIGNLIESQFLSARDWPFGSAASVVLMGVIAGFLLLYYWMLVKNR